MVSLYHKSLSLALISSGDPSLTPHSCSHNAYQMPVLPQKSREGRNHVVLVMPRSLFLDTVPDNAGLLNEYQVMELTQKGCNNKFCWSTKAG